METNRAVVVDPHVTGRLSIQSVPAPAPERAEAIVRVHAISLNRGEVRRSTQAPAGWRPDPGLGERCQSPAVDGDRKGRAGSDRSKIPGQGSADGRVNGRPR
jgi:hypothetical protein